MRVNVGAIDLTILLAYLGAVVVFGLWIGRRTKTAADFMVGGRDLPTWTVLFSIVATETSTVTFLSIPGLAWSGDLTFLQLPIGFAVGRVVVTVLLLPRYLRGDVVTAYEVLHERFGGGVRRLTSLMFVVTRTLGDGLRLFLGAIVLQEVAGIDLFAAITILGMATIAYTLTGGIRAVVWTDTVQFVVYMVGAAVAFWILLDRVDGGFDAIATAADAEGKLRVLDLSFDATMAHQFWTGLIGGAVLSVGTHGVDQLMVQRYLCARSPRGARLALLLSGPVVFVQFAFFLVIGTALWAFYEANPPAEPFARADRVFATFITRELPLGVCGVVLGAVFSAAMSTLSSSLNSTATSLVHDVLHVTDDQQRLRVVKLYTIGFGLAQMAVGITGQWLDGSIVGHVLSIQTFATGIILGVFLLGMGARRVGPRAAFSGVACGLALTTIVKFATPLAWPWFALLGAVSTYVSGHAAALLTRTR